MMLPTAEVVTEVMFDGGVAAAFAVGTAWAQMGTIGVTQTQQAAARLSQLRPDVMYVDAPVSGSKGPAEAGKLLILASGPAAAEPAVRPAFAAIGRKTVWLGEAGQGSKLKLAVNAYMCTLIEGVAEALELADRLGIDPSAWVRPSRAARSTRRSPTPSCTRWRAVTSRRSSRWNGRSRTWTWPWPRPAAARLPLLAALSRQWHTAVAAGHGREDVSAARLALGGT